MSLVIEGAEVFLGAAMEHKQLPVSDVEAAVKVILQSMSTDLSEGKRVKF